jgi:hypothetical protein
VQKARIVVGVLSEYKLTAMAGDNDKKNKGLFGSFKSKW